MGLGVRLVLTVVGKGAVEGLRRKRGRNLLGGGKERSGSVGGTIITASGGMSRH